VPRAARNRPQAARFWAGVRPKADRARSLVRRATRPSGRAAASQSAELPRGREGDALRAGGDVCPLAVRLGVSGLSPPPCDDPDLLACSGNLPRLGLSCANSTFGAAAPDARGRNDAGHRVFLGHLTARKYAELQGCRAQNPWPQAVGVRVPPPHQMNSRVTQRGVTPRFMFVPRPLSAGCPGTNASGPTGPAGWAPECYPLTRIGHDSLHPVSLPARSAVREPEGRVVKVLLAEPSPDWPASAGTQRPS